MRPSFQAYDQHLNMILSEVEEIITTMELDEETFEEIYKVLMYIILKIFLTLERGKS